MSRRLFYDDVILLHHTALNTFGVSAMPDLQNYNKSVSVKDKNLKIQLSLGLILIIFLLIKCRRQILV